MEARKVVIFGAGPTGIRVYNKYNGLVDIVAITDNDETKWGKYIGGVEVVSPETAVSLKYDKFIIASVQGRASIRSQLRSQRVSDEKIFFDSGFQEDTRLTLYKKYRTILEDVSGSIAELGVFRGETAAIMNEAFPERYLYLFDTFEGFDRADITTEQKNGFSAAQAGEFSETTLELVMGRMPYPEKCVPKKGWFPDSASGISEQFALVRLDVDLYEPTVAGLRWFSERLSPGGCMIIDDYFNESYAGVKAAVDEYCVSHQDKKLLPFGIGFTAVLI